MVRQSSDAIRGKDQPMLRERRMFRLLLQSNPNYFGNAAFSHLPARSPVSCNTYYEALSCLGYSPEKRQLAAVISLFRSSGYGAGTRISSAPEYVRFYFFFRRGARAGRIRVVPAWKCAMWLRSATGNMPFPWCCRKMLRPFLPAAPGSGPYRPGMMRPPPGHRTGNRFLAGSWRLRSV